MKKLNIALIGANGYIGAALCEKLKGVHNVYAVVNSGKANAIETVYSNLTKQELTTYFKEKNIDVIFNLAWRGSTGDNRNNVEMQESNFVFCKMYYEIAQEINAEYICTGTIAELPEAPETYYGVAKKELKNYFKGKPNVHWWTLSFIFGGHDVANRILLSLLKNMLSNKKVQINTTGEQLFPCMYIDDFCEEVLRKLNERDFTSQIFFDTYVPFKDFVLEMKKVTRSNSEVVFGDIVIKNEIDSPVNREKLHKYVVQFVRDFTDY